MNNITLKSERHSKTEGTASVDVVDWILRHTKTFLRHSNRRVSFIQHKITLLQTKNRTAYKGASELHGFFYLFYKKNYERVDRIEDGKWTPTLLKVIDNTLESEPHYFLFTSLNVFQQTQHKFFKYIFPSEVYFKVLRSGLLLRPECTVVSSFIFSLEFSFPLVHCIHFFG